jgi:hypothetical protein
MPDICAWLENPTAGSERRYVAWYDRYLMDEYSAVMGCPPTKQVFLTGEDCYALRCAFLHEGSDDIARQRARKALSSFYFVAPHPGLSIHCNKIEDVLQLQVDIFCHHICDAVDRWSLDVLQKSPEAQGRLGEILVVHSCTSLPFIHFGENERESGASNGDSPPTNDSGRVP